MPLAPAVRRGLGGMPSPCRRILTKSQVAISPTTREMSNPIVHAFIPVHLPVGHLTFAFCRAALSAKRRGIGVGQQRAVRLPFFARPAPPRKMNRYFARSNTRRLRATLPRRLGLGRKGLVT